MVDMSRVRLPCSTHTWRHKLSNAVACKGLLWEAGVVGINCIRVPAPKHVQPGAQHIQDIGLIHEPNAAVSVAAAPYRTLQPLLRRLGGVARLKQDKEGRKVI